MSDHDPSEPGAPEGGWQAPPPPPPPPPPPAPQGGAAPPGPPAGSFGPPSAPVPAATWVPPPPESTATRTGAGGRIAALIVGVALLVGGVGFAVARAGGNGPGSPEAAVRALLGAVADEDVIGVLQAMPAGERRAIQQPLEDIADELVRLGVLDDSFRLDGIGGVEISFEGVELEVEDLGDGIAAVHLIGGTAHGAIVPEELPLGVPLLDMIERLTGEPVEIPAVSGSSDVEPDSAEEVPLVAVRDGGSWRVSLGYTIAEAARRDAGLPLPAFGEGVVPAGAPSPEDAVRQLAEAGLALDVRRVLELMPPGEMSALHDYAPLFLDDLEREARSHAPDVRRFDLDLASDASGDLAKVRVERLALDVEVDGVVLGFGIDGDELSFRVEDGRSTVSFDGECFTYEDDWSDGPEEQCLDEIGELPFDLEDTLQHLTVTTVRLDGQWYVSPVRSTLGLMAEGLGALPDDALDSLADALEEMFDGFGGALFGMAPGGTWDDEWGAWDDEWDDWDSEWDEEWDGGVEDRDQDAGGWRDWPTVPTVEGLAATLVAEGFGPAEADCVALGVHGLGLDQETLLVLEINDPIEITRVPDEVWDRIYEVMDDCGAW
jgi:hypothetical protein